MQYDSLCAAFLGVTSSGMPVWPGHPNHAPSLWLLPYTRPWTINGGISAIFFHLLKLDMGFESAL